MLYTSYISNIKNIPDNMRKIIVMRYMPKSLKDPKYNLEWMPSLAPSEDLLNNYKSKGLTFSMFNSSFVEELLTRKDAKDSIENILKDLNQGNEICLICCEKDYMLCHRTIVRHLITGTYNAEDGGEL